MTVIKRIILNQGNINSIFLLDESLLEPSMLKGIRWVLRRGKESNLLVLSDFSYENYKIGINKYKIIPVIFPKEIFNINKFQDQMSYSLMIYKNKNNIEENKKLTNHLQRLLLIKLENWKEYKPVRGIIEDFFKASKEAFGLGKFHSFTNKSMYKNIYLCLLLTTIVVQTGFKTKTQLQQLAEGKIEFQQPKNKKNKKKKDTNETKEKTETPNKMGQQTLEIQLKQRFKTLNSF
jgi:hypothetical protein